MLDPIGDGDNFAGGVGVARRFAKLPHDGFADEIEGQFLDGEALDAHGVA
jgi:hypothetical protein